MCRNRVQNLGTISAMSRLGITLGHILINGCKMIVSIREHRRCEPGLDLWSFSAEDV